MLKRYKWYFLCLFLGFVINVVYVEFVQPYKNKTISNQTQVVNKK